MTNVNEKQQSDRQTNVTEGCKFKAQKKKPKKTYAICSKYCAE